MTATVFALALLVVVIGTLAVGSSHPRDGRARMLLLGDSFAVGLSASLRAELATRAELVTVAREGESLEGYRRAHPGGLIPRGAWDLVLVSFGTNDFAAGESSAARAHFTDNAADWLWEAGQERNVRTVWLLPPDMPALPGCAAWVSGKLPHADPTICSGLYVLPPPSPLELGPDRIHPTGRAYQSWARSLAARIFLR